MVAGATSTHPASTSRQVLMHGWREQIISGLMLVIGIALCVAPWVGGDGPDAAKDIHRNEIGVAILVLAVAIARLSRHVGTWSDMIMLLAGGWLVASPWLLGLRNTAVFDGAQVFDVAAGAVLIALAAASMALRALLRREEPDARHG
ncbi:SPW repeat domain-containing protein [Streptomyces sp. 24-1644]|uniref:SPW repeat domain-containing protein n=1 Tax=unclassified Streptomyces TaxID=2593676 RepID=UPI00365590E1